jgi:hypothetical protein
MGGLSEEHGHERVHYLYTALAEQAAALAGTKNGSLDEWLDLIAAEGPPHETWSGGTIAPTIDGLVLQPSIPAIERLCIVSSHFCRHLEAVTIAEAVGITPKSVESAPSQRASVANAEITAIAEKTEKIVKTDPALIADPDGRPPSTCRCQADRGNVAFATGLRALANTPDATEPPKPEAIKQGAKPVRRGRPRQGKDTLPEVEQFLTDVNKYAQSSYNPFRELRRQITTRDFSRVSGYTETTTLKRVRQGIGREGQLAKFRHTLKHSPAEFIKQLADELGYA